MLCKISFSSDESIHLPMSYNYIIQSVLYRFINEESYADFMHNKGYSFNKRSYKLFSFSNILEKPSFIDREKKRFVFPKDISLYFSSVNNDFFKYVFNSIINIDEGVNIGQNKAVISKIELIRQNISQKETVAAMSPITTYSTLLTSENRKKTYYYNPDEEEFSLNIRKNLINKYMALYGNEPENDEFRIVPKKNIRESIIKYKGFIIKGYIGSFDIEGSQELMDMAFCAGLGSKNSQGLGLIVKENLANR